MENADKIKKELEAKSVEITKIANECERRGAGETWSEMVKKSAEAFGLAMELVEIEPDTEFEPPEPDLSKFMDYLSENAKVMVGERETMILLNGLALAVPTATNEAIVEAYKELAGELEADEEEAELAALEVIDFVQYDEEKEPLIRALISAELATYTGEIIEQEGFLMQMAVYSKLGPDQPFAQ